MNWVFHLLIRFFAFIEKFNCLEGFRNFSKLQLSPFSEDLIRQVSLLIDNDDILLMSFSKAHLQPHTEQFHYIAKEQKLKLALEKSFFVLLTVNYLGHQIGFNTIKPSQSKLAGILKNPL